MKYNIFTPPTKSKPLIPKALFSFFASSSQPLPPTVRFRRTFHGLRFAWDWLVMLFLILVLHDVVASPVPTEGIFTQVSSGENHSCALKTDGSVACWGDNWHGQAIPPVGTFTQVSSGEGYTCALRTDGSVACWGWGSNGVAQATVAFLPPAGTFTQISSGGGPCALKTDGSVACWVSKWYDPAMLPAGTFTQISSGGLHTCALRTDGSVSCWGYNMDGQATPPVDTFTQVSSGSGHTCALRTDGSVACWGYNENGEATPPVGTFTQVSSGGHHTCALRTDGSVACWGYNENGEATPPVGTFTQVSSGYSHTCALKTDGNVACWGRNMDGQATPASTFTQVSSSLGHTCALRTDGSVACWGNNGAGEASPPVGTFTQVSSAHQRTCALRTDGSIACWGWGKGDFAYAGTFIQISISSGGVSLYALKTDGGVACLYDAYGCASPTTGTFTQISSGDEHTCALRTDGSLACWGHNWYGEATPPAGTFTQVSSGDEHTCALRTDGNLACWGGNEAGQATPPAGTFTQVSSGGSNTCALKTDGSVACWGENGAGQALPPPPAGTFTQVNSGGERICAVRTDGGITCWSGGNVVISASSSTIIPPNITTVTNTTATLGTPVIFTVTGTNLTDGMELTLTDCPTPIELPGGTDTQRQFQCTPNGAAGSKTGMVKTIPNGEILYNFTVEVSDLTVTLPQIKITSVTTTTATVGTSVTFTLTGTNLKDGIALTLTDCPTPVELPGGSDTQRQFQCTPTGTAGTKTGIVKFVPNDEILYDFTVEVNDSTVVLSQIAGVTPATAVLDTPVIFTLTGANLTDGMTLTLTDCPTPTELPGGTDTQRQFQCTPTGTAGTKTGTVKVKDSNGEVLYNFNVEVSKPLPTTLNAPTDLTATATGTQVTLHWTDHSDNETGFKILREGVELTTVATNLTQFVDTGLTCGTSHIYVVKATNATGDSAPATTNVTLPPCLYTLTLKTQGTGKGTIGGTQAGQYPQNTSISLTAQPDQDSEWVGWTPATCGNPFALTANTTCIAEFDLNRQQVEEVLSNFCTLNPDFIDCQVFETANKCPPESTDPICQVRFYPVTLVGGTPSLAVYEKVQPNKTVRSLIGLNMVFMAYGDNLTDGTKMAVENCENMTLLPNGTSSRRDFFCKQWGLPGDRKGIVKDHNGVELYQFDVKVLYTCKAVKDLPLKECETLDNIYQGTQGGAWKNAGTNKWLVDVSPCGWAGITCANGHVTHLRLADNNLTGTMPDICPLAELKELDISNNRLTGNLPNLCQSGLEVANFSNNQFSGTLPDLTGLTQLKTLGLANNQLEGKVPDFSQFPNLKVSLGGNQLLSGTLSVTQPIPEVVVPQGSSPMTIDLTPYFKDTSGGPITYRMGFNSNANVVTTSLQNNNLLLTFGGPGLSEITVEARDSVGMTVQSTFKVTVNQAVQMAVYTPSCSNEGETIESSCVGQEQVLKVSKIEEQASISNIIVDSSIENHGWISNSKVTSNGSLTGGTLTGYISNEGTITNVDFVGAELKGGTLSGKIVNNSKTGGVIKDVKLDKDTVLQGGNVQGNIEGNCDSPALLEDVTVKNGSTLSCVVLGKNVTLEKDVKQDRVTSKEQTQGDTGPTAEVEKVTEMVIGNLVVYADSIVPDGNSKSVFIASGNVKLGMVSLDSSGQQQKGNQIISVDARLKLDFAQKRVETLEDGQITALGIKRIPDPDKKDPGEDMPLYRGGFTVKVSDLKSSIVKNLPQLEIKPGGMSLQRLFPQDLYPFTAGVPQTIEIDSSQVVIKDSAANFSELFDNFFINLPKIQLSQEGNSEHNIELIAEDALRFRNNNILRLSDVKVTLDLLSYKYTIGGKVSAPDDKELFGIFESLGGELKFWKTTLNGFEISAEGNFLTVPPKAIPMGINFVGAKIAIENFAYPDSLKFSLGTTVRLVDGFGLLEKFEDYTTLKFLSGEGELSADTSWKIQVALKKAMLLDKLKLGEGSIEYKPGEGLSVDGRLGVSMKKFARQNEEEVELLSLKINPPLKVSATDSKLETNGGGELSITIPEICLDVYITEICSSEKKVDVTAVTFGVSVSDKVKIDEATGKPIIDAVTGKPEIKTGLDYIRFTFDAGGLGIKVEYTDTLHFYTRLSSDEYTLLRKAIRRTDQVVTLEVNQPDETVVFQMVSKTGEPSFTLKFPDGRVFQPATTPGLFEVSKTNSEVAYLHSANKHQASYVVKKPPQGTYTVEVNNLGDIGEYELNLLYTPKKPTIKLVSLAQDQNWDSQSPVNIAWQFTDPNGGAKVSLYYDNDNTGYNGSLIAADIPVADGHYEWKAPAEMQSGHYYLYVKLDDGKDIPVYAYSTGKLAVTNSEAPTTPTAVTLKAGDGNLEVSWSANPEDNLASYRVHVSDTPGDNQFEQDIGVGLQTSYTIAGLTNGKTYEVAVSAINNKGLVSLLSTPQTQTPLGDSDAGDSDVNTTAIDALGLFTKTNSHFKGGISVNGEPELPNVTHTTSDEISVIGEMTTDFAHLGKVVDWLVIGIYKPTPTSVPQLYMLEEPEVPIEQRAQAVPVIRPWDGDPKHLVAMKKAVILRPTQRLNLWQGQLSATGEVQVYYGYRLPDGTIVLNPQPLEDVITE